MLYYEISKMAHFKDIDENCLIAINYIPTKEMTTEGKREDEFNEYELSKYKRQWVADMLGISYLFVIPITKERYISDGDKVL